MLNDKEEIKSNPMEMQNWLQQLNQNKAPIDFNKKFKTALRTIKGYKSQQDLEDEKIVKEKLAAGEKERKPINFFNKNANKLISRSKFPSFSNQLVADNKYFIAPVDILCELGVRTFSGSRDVPKDDHKAMGLFNWACNLSTTPGEARMTAYYTAIFNKYRLKRIV